MVEACKYGDVDIIQSLIMTLSLSDDSSSIWCQLCAAINNAGIFAISFKEKSAAQRFVLEMNSAGPHRSYLFHDRDILTVWIPTSEVPPSDSTSHSHVNPYAHSISVVKETIPAQENNTETVNNEQGEDLNVIQDAEDVEDFLNSLL